MKLRRLFAKAPAAHACHFCGQASVLVPPYGDGDAQLARVQGRAARVSSGTPARWFCSACGSWNHRGANGEVLDVWERAMWDAGANESAFATPSKVREEDHVFCRDCLTNQTIVTNLLANYLSGDEAADEGLLATLPEYKRSLEARYPIACEACAQKANAHIASVDQRVQQQLLGTWVERHAAPRDVRDEAAAFQAAVRRWHWQQRHWALVQASGLGLGLYMAQHSAPDAVVAALCLGALVPTTYDPMWRRAEAIRRRNAHPVEHGLVVWKVRRSSYAAYPTSALDSPLRPRPLCLDADCFLDLCRKRCCTGADHRTSLCSPSSSCMRLPAAASRRPSPCASYRAR